MHVYMYVIWYFFYLRCRPANLVQSEEAKNKDNVIRQPKGPDGTKGFKSDR